ncbi:MAG: DUF2339 domain-containing protein [Mediterranea sp.]|jgi:uncharacterized membrane protein|nr:DUF2339 domain-containing protein [Mediterranea sp.]
MEIIVFIIFSVFILLILIVIGVQSVSSKLSKQSSLLENVLDKIQDMSNQLSSTKAPEKATTTETETGKDLAADTEPTETVLTEYPLYAIEADETPETSYQPNEKAEEENLSEEQFERTMELPEALEEPWEKPYAFGDERASTWDEAERAEERQEEDDDDEEDDDTTPKRQRPSINYEKYIGENLFGKIGILIFVIGVGFFVKYAIDQNWISETLRTVLGFLIGAGLLFVAQRLEKKYRTFSSLLAGGAFAVFYLTVAIAYHYYHLFSSTTSFAILVGSTLFMSILSLLYDRRELAITALLGGFIAPFIASSDSGNYLALLSYLSILNMGMFALTFRKPWRELPIISFVATWAITILCINSIDIASIPTLAFATFFYLIFLVPILVLIKDEKEYMRWILMLLIVINNFIYLGVGMHCLHLIDSAIVLDGLLPLFIASANMALLMWLRRKNKQENQSLIHTMLGMVVTFISITVPFQLEGSYITLCWSAEAVLLPWLYAKSRIPIYEFGAVVLTLLTGISFLLDTQAFRIETVPDTIFLNHTFATSMFVGLSAAAFAWLMERKKELFSTGTRTLRYKIWNPLMIWASIAIIYYAFVWEFFMHLPNPSGAILLFTNASFAALVYGLERRFRITRHTRSYVLSMLDTTLIYILFFYFEWLQWGPGEYFFPTHWLALACIVVHCIIVTRQYHAAWGLNTRFIIYLTILSTVLWLVTANLLAVQVDLYNYSALFSIAFTIAGFVQMALGMRFHQKSMRLCSLIVFGVVLLKLLLIDLWAMPTIGKIVTFILLGAILLVLSFLYQRLKNVLFKADDEPIHEDN